MPPFDPDLASPIARIRELRARAPGAVVTIAGLSELQEAAFVATETERRLQELVAGDAGPDLFLISGSAGSGKSALIDRLVREHAGHFEQVVQDATHSDSPSETQADVLERFFEPFADGVGGPDRPRLIAANIGLLLAFFAVLRNREEPDRFTTLEAVLKYRLGVSTSTGEPPEAPWTAAVLNLDLRPTVGPGALLTEMLRLADFDNPDGLVSGAPRCGTCQVRAWCPVRSNSIVASQVGTAAIDTLAVRAAAERGRHDSPRALWDLVSRLLCGDDAFDDRDDPCEAVADAAGREDREWVWERILPRRLFAVGGELGARFQGLDPSRQPSARAHRTIAAAGIRPSADASRLRELDPGTAEAIATCGEHLASGRVSPPIAGRGLVAASYLTDPDCWPVGDETARSFDKLLAEYQQFSNDDGGDYPALESLRRLLERSLGRSFGALEADTPYIPIKAYDPRDPSRIFVRASLEYDPAIYQVAVDPPLARDAAGAQLAGHRPLAVTVRLGAVEVAITLPVYRLLEAAAAGTVASTSDLARFYGLRRAVEALARAAAAAGRELAVERPATARRYQVRRSTTIGGQEVVVVQELSR